MSSGTRQMKHPLPAAAGVKEGPRSLRPGPCRAGSALTVHGLAGSGIEDQKPVVVTIAAPAEFVAVEIEQTIERPRDLIEGAAFRNGLRRPLIDPTEPEIVLDK